MEAFSQLVQLAQKMSIFVSGWVSDHYTVVYLFSSSTAFFCALILLALHNRVVPSKWAKWFGLAFVVFTVQYGVPFLLSAAYHPRLAWLPPEGLKDWVGFKAVLVALCSCANNLLFLATARALVAARHLSDDSRLIPTWAWVVAGVSLVSVLDFYRPGLAQAYPALNFVRLPDAVFSAYCLVELGIASANYVSIKRWHPKTIFAMLIAFAYALVQVAYGLHPLLAQTTWGDSFIPRYDSPAAKVSFFDFNAFGAATVLKFLLFFNVYVILVRQLSTFKSWRKAISGVINGRVEFTSSYKGLVGVIGKMLHAELVDLSIKLPGLEKLPEGVAPGGESERVASFEWTRDAASRPKRERTVVKLLRAETETHPKAEAVIRWCVETGLPLSHPPRRAARGVLSLLGSRGARQSGGNGQRELPPDVEAELSTKNALLVVPVIYHGAVVGCLKVEKRRGKFNDLARLLLRDTAGLASLSIQSFRELAALDKFSFEFTRFQADEKMYPPREAAERLSNILQDILSPVVARLNIDFGFESLDPVFSADKPASERIKGIVKEAAGGRDYDDLPEDIEVPTNGYLKLLPSRLKVKSLDRKEYEVGDIFLTVWRDKDTQVKPVLSTNYLHRKTVASFTVDAFFDFARDYFAHLLKELALTLNKEQFSITKWRADVEETARQAGLLWAVASEEGGDGLLGDPAAVALVERLRAKHGDSTELAHWPAHDIKGPPDEQCELTRRTEHVIGIYLPSERHIWFGASRRGFGAELAFASPWKSFLENLAQVADGALVRFTAALDLEELQLEAARSTGLAAVTYITGSIPHTLKNMVRDQLAHVVSMLEDINQGALHVGQEPTQRLRQMKEKVEQGLKVLEGLTDLTRIDDSCPCQLRKAKDQAMALYRSGLMSQQISVSERVSGGLVVDVPLYVVVLTFINLIDNAKDAIGSKGRIVIEAEENGDSVVCRVSDTGPGIQLHPPDSIFKIGVTTKEKSGGWGLHLVRKLLTDHGASIAVTDWHPGKTMFTITFPKHNQEGAR